MAAVTFTTAFTYLLWILFMEVLQIMEEWRNTD